MQIGFNSSINSQAYGIAASSKGADQKVFRGEHLLLNRFTESAILRIACPTEFDHPDFKDAPFTEVKHLSFSSDQKYFNFFEFLRATRSNGVETIFRIFPNIESIEIGNRDYPGFLIPETIRGKSNEELKTFVDTFTNVQAANNTARLHSLEVLEA